MARRVLLSWSGGKDSALALLALLRDPSVEVTGLVTTITEGYERVSMHGVRRSLVLRQARLARLPLVELRIPPGCPNDVYEERVLAALRAPHLPAVEHVAFGDLFLRDVRAYRERLVERAGKRALFPLWGRDTSALAREFLAAGFRALLVCVDPGRLDPCFAGRAYDALLADLPAGVDACGENGEFHTFVDDGPILATPVGCRRGERRARDGFVFCDLLAP